MIVRDILGALDSKVSEILPTYNKSVYVYDLDKNNRKAMKKIYAIRTQAGTSTSGVLQSVTMSQDFEVILSDIYQPKGDNDRDIETKILSIHDDIEKLYKEIYQKRLDLSSAQVLLVELVDITAPEIDIDNNYVSIGLTFKVKYRTPI